MITDKIHSAPSTTDQYNVIKNKHQRSGRHNYLRHQSSASEFALNKDSVAENLAVQQQETIVNTLTPRTDKNSHNRDRSDTIPLYGSSQQESHKTNIDVHRSSKPITKDFAPQSTNKVQEVWTKSSQSAVTNLPAPSATQNGGYESLLIEPVVKIVKYLYGGRSVADTPTCPSSKLEKQTITTAVKDSRDKQIGDSFQAICECTNSDFSKTQASNALISFERMLAEYSKSGLFDDIDDTGAQADAQHKSLHMHWRDENGNYRATTIYLSGPITVNKLQRLNLANERWTKLINDNPTFTIARIANNIAINDTRPSIEASRYDLCAQRAAHSIALASDPSVKFVNSPECKLQLQGVAQYGTDATRDPQDIQMMPTDDTKEYNKYDPRHYSEFESVVVMNNGMVMDLAIPQVGAAQKSCRIVSKNSELKAELAYNKTIDDTTKYIQGLEDKNIRLNTTVNQLQEQLDQTRANLASVQAKNADLIELNKNYERSNTFLQSTSNITQQMLNTCTQDLKTTLASVDKKQDNILDEQNRIQHTIGANHNVTNDKLNGIQEQNQQLDVKLENIQKTADNLTNTVNNVDKTATYIKQDTHNINTNITDIKQDTHNINTNITDIKQDIHNIAGNVTDIKQDVQTINTEMINVNKTATQLAEKVEQLGTDVKENVDKLTNYTEQIQDTVKTVNVTFDSTKMLHNKVDSLHDKVNDIQLDMTEHVDNLHQHFTNMSAEINMYSTSLAASFNNSSVSINSNIKAVADNTSTSQKLNIGAIGGSAVLLLGVSVAAAYKWCCGRSKKKQQNTQSNLTSGNNNNSNQSLDDVLNPQLQQFNKMRQERRDRNNNHRQREASALPKYLCPNATIVPSDITYKSVCPTK